MKETEIPTGVGWPRKIPSEASTDIMLSNALRRSPDYLLALADMHAKTPNDISPRPLVVFSVGYDTTYSVDQYSQRDGLYLLQVRRTTEGEQGRETTVTVSGHRRSGQQPSRETLSVVQNGEKATGLLARGRVASVFPELQFSQAPVDNPSEVNPKAVFVR